jgi:hypothetical protein
MWRGCGRGCSRIFGGRSRGLLRRLFRIVSSAAPCSRRVSDKKYKVGGKERGGETGTYEEGCIIDKSVPITWAEGYVSAI